MSIAGFTQPPFAAPPDLRCCFECPSFRQAQTELRDCLTAARGIAVLTAAAGTGKTLLCGRLAEELGGSFRVISLPTGFAGVEGFLKTVLFEMGQPYRDRSEQELRLQFASAARGLLTERPAILLIDEAHTLADEVFDDVRRATTLIDDGQALVRVLLAGQFPLEERLATPRLEAVNQRIGCHVTLEPLSRAEARDYIDFRLQRAGSNVDATFTPEAVETIVVAADGNPQRLNQLCERAIGLRTDDGGPVDDAMVRRALDELKRLPLHWQEPPPPRDAAHSPESTPAIESEPRQTTEPTTGADPAVVEFGSEQEPARESETPQRRPERHTATLPSAVVEFGSGPAGTSRDVEPVETSADIPGEAAAVETMDWERLEDDLPVDRSPSSDTEVIEVADRHASLLDQRRRLTESPPRSARAASSHAAVPPPRPRVAETDSEPAAVPTKREPQPEPATLRIEPRTNAPRRDARQALEQQLRELEFDSVLPREGDALVGANEDIDEIADVSAVDLVDRLHALDARR